MSNILLVTVDDMRYDELKYMPNTRRLLGGKGTTFTACRANVPLCSPVRAGIITGQYSKDHGVTTQSHNPTTNALDNSVFVALDNAGFRCGLIGKWLTAAAAGSVKPGFEFWRGLVGDSQSATAYGIYDGTSTITPGTYQDHYLAGQAIDFLRGAEPWFLWYCPTSPHWPNTDPPNHQTEWGSKQFALTLESDVSDKPTWIQARSAVDASMESLLREEERLRIRELLATDDALGAMVSLIQASGLADDTTVIFCSDNGVMLGEHRLYGGFFGVATVKNVPYDPSMRVPLVAVGPDFDRQTVTAPTCHQDITATLLDVANTAALLGDQAGVSLVDVAATPASYASRQLLHHRDPLGGGSDDGYPAADGITTATRKLWRHQGETGTDEFEMYDLDTDPDELVNVANDAGRLTERNTLETALDALLA